MRCLHFASVALIALSSPIYGAEVTATKANDFLNSIGFVLTSHKGWTPMPLESPPA